MLPPGAIALSPGRPGPFASATPAAATATATASAAPAETRWVRERVVCMAGTFRARVGRGRRGARVPYGAAPRSDETPRSADGPELGAQSRRPLHAPVDGRCDGRFVAHQRHTTSRPGDRRVEQLAGGEPRTCRR